MGQKDLAQNEYFKDKRRFADVCNGILFQGREVIRPEELQEKEADIIFYNPQEQLNEIIADTVMMWNGMCINLVGIESQTKVDYSMVFRLMKEEALSYDKQWNENAGEWARSIGAAKEVNYAWSPEGKEARFTPVILLVIYFGIDKKWDGARCLYDMLDMNKEVEPYISNYKMNLFDFHDCNDFSVFKTENRLLFETLANCKTKRQMYKFMKAHEEEYEKWDVLTTKLVCTLLGLKHEKILKKMTEEGMSMCRALEELVEDAREEGREEGKEIGKKETLSTLVNNLMSSMHVSMEKAKELLKIAEIESGKQVVS